MGFKCEICGKELPTERGYKVHMTRMHMTRMHKSVAHTEDAPPVTLKAGDRVLLNGLVWRQSEAAPYEWEESTANDLMVEVLGLEPNPEGTLYAYAKAPGSKALWGFSVINFTVYTICYDGMSVPPEMSRAIDRQEFVPALTEYVSARDSKLVAENVFKKVSKDYRGTVESFIIKYGKESEEGKQDFVVYENGFKCQMARTPGSEVVSYDDEARMRWIMEDYENRKYLLKTIVDQGQWNLAEGEGRIPAELLATAKNIKMTDDRFSLLVSLDKGE